MSLSTNLWSQTSICDVEMMCCRTAFQSVVEFVFSSGTSPEPSCLKLDQIKGITITIVTVIAILVF